ncbi:MAG: hypothetical protein ACRDWY_02340 [Actinomycetes bacterium]
MTALSVLALYVRAVDDNDVSPGVLGFLVVALLGVGTYLLIRSMNRQIRRIDLPDEREPEDAEEGGEPGEGRGAAEGHGDRAP